MKIKSLKIFYIKKKNYKSQFPNPSFYKDGFVFIKLISDNNLEDLVNHLHILINQKY